VSSIRGPERLAARGAGSHEADLLRELHEQHASALWSYALRLTGDRVRAQDVVQETGDASEQAVNRHLVAAALGRLTQEHRDVLRECYFRGSSVAQAAHALGIAPGTVKSRTYYALRALRLAIEELGGVE
jgi:RNA polymerase sigma-70 factor, ECF subfamily